MHTSPESFQRPVCHERTRVAILKYLSDWIDRVIEDQAKIMWMYGDVGAGKSTIAQTLAERCNLRQLLASFFFSRNDGSRASHTSIVSTIVYQAARAIPGLKALVKAAVEENPQIFKQNIAVQMKELLVNPLNLLVGRTELQTHTLPFLIIIDGLDECTDSKIQCHILDVFADALQKCDFPLKVFVASRPEINISSSFDSPRLSTISTCLALSHSFDADDDIRVYLEDQFDSIRTTHPLKRFIPPSWPEPQVVDDIVQKSSGQFVFASTIIQYVSSPDHQPVHRLEIVLRLKPTTSETDLPFTNLDILYKYIFSRVLEEHLKTTLQILGLVTLRSFLAERMLQVHLKRCDHIRSILSLAEGDVECSLGALSSVIRCDDGRVHVIHASFTDFLKDRRRSQDYYVGDDGTIRATIIVKCLEHLEQDEDIGKPQSPLTMAKTYLNCWHPRQRQL